MNPQETQAIINFTTQRDSLLREISVAQQEVDRLLDKNKTLREDNSSILTQLEVNKALVLEVLNTSEAVGIISKAKKLEIDNSLQEKMNALLQISNVLETTIAFIEAMPNKLKNVIEQLDVITYKVTDINNTILSTSHSIKSATIELNNVVSSQVNDVMSRIDPLANRIAYVNSKEAELVNRQQETQTQINTLVEMKKIEEGELEVKRLGK